MQAVSFRSAQSPFIRLFAQLFHPDPRAVNAWMREHWIPTPDPAGVEWIKIPEFRVIEKDWRGDCDDASVFAAAVLMAKVRELEPNWRAEFVAVRLPREPEYSHVWLQCQSSDGLVVDIDPIVPLASLPVRGYADRMTVRLF